MPPGVLACRVVATAAERLDADRAHHGLLVLDGNVDSACGGRRCGVHLGAPRIGSVYARLSGHPGNSGSTQVHGARAIEYDFVAVRSQDVALLNGHVPGNRRDLPIGIGSGRGTHQGTTDDAPAMHEAIVAPHAVAEIVLLKG